MRPIRVPIAATGTDPVVVPLDIYQRWTSLAVVDVDGVIDVDLQYTLDDIFSESFDQATAQWFNLIEGITAAAQHNLAKFDDDAADDQGGSPIIATAVRALNVGAGTAVLQVVQSGVMG